MKASNLKLEEIYSVEIVGGSSRIPSIKRASYTAKYAAHPDDEEDDDALGHKEAAEKANPELDRLLETSFDRDHGIGM